MNSQEQQKIDGFASRYDSPDSIGAKPKKKAVENGDVIEAFDFYAPGDAMASMTNTDIIGRKRRMGKRKRRRLNAKDAARKAANTAKDIQKVTAKVTKVASGISKFSTHPATMAVIAATATIVPMGTVVAGIATAGLAILNGVARIAGPVIKIVSKLVKGLGKFFKSIGRAFMSKKKKRRLLERANRRKNEAKAKLNAGVNDAAKLIGKQMILANRGDKNAQKQIIALQAAAKSGVALKELTGNKGKVAEDFMKAAIEKAGVLRATFEKVKPPPKKTKEQNIRVMKRTSQVLNKGVKKVEQKVKAKVDKPREGILVSGVGKTKRGKFRARGRQKAFLVEKSGKVRVGNWA